MARVCYLFNMGILVIYGIIHTPWTCNNGGGITNPPNLVDYKSVGLHIQPQRELTNTLLGVPPNLYSNPTF